MKKAYTDSYLELSCPEYNYMARLNYLHSIHMNIRFRSSILLFICMSKHQNPMQLHAYIQQLRKRNFWLRATNRKPGLNPTTDCFKRDQLNVLILPKIFRLHQYLPETILRFTVTKWNKLSDLHSSYKNKCNLWKER